MKPIDLYCRPAAVTAILSLLTTVHSFAAWGVTDTGSRFRVDSGAGLVFEVGKTDGSIFSIKLNGGGELNQASKFSQLNSGLPTNPTTSPNTYVQSVNWAFYSGNTIIRLTVSTPTLTHYYVVRQNQNIIYMATAYKDGASPYGELRWITRLAPGFTAVPDLSDIRGGTTIESSDVYELANGDSRSKYYGNQHARNLGIRGVTRSGYGVFMVYGNRESSSGGPFFRDIQNQTTQDNGTEVYNYMYSGHNQTDTAKTGVLHGPYALVFTTGATPAAPDMSFMNGLGLDNWVSSRGSVYGDAGSIPAGITATVGFEPVSPLPAGQSPGQYWTSVNPTTRDYSCGGMKPGSYIQTVYHGELEVATETVVVTAGTSKNNNMTPTFFIPANPIWRLGVWDGTPNEFFNGAAIPNRHPSDDGDSNPATSATWPAYLSFGTNPNPPAASFPAIQFRGKNPTITLKFTLDQSQIANRTLRIGITGAYGGGRPSVQINGQPTSSQSATSQPSSRSFTIGTYRGNNRQLAYAISAADLVVGTNTITMSPISGSSDLGTFLSASYAFDCLELY